MSPCRRNTVTSPMSLRSTFIECATFHRWGQQPVLTTEQAARHLLELRFPFTLKRRPGVPIPHLEVVVHPDQHRVFRDACVLAKMLRYRHPPLIVRPNLRPAPKKKAPEIQRPCVHRRIFARLGPDRVPCFLMKHENRPVIATRQVPHKMIVDIHPFPEKARHRDPALVVERGLGLTKIHPKTPFNPKIIQNQPLSTTKIPLSTPICKTFLPPRSQPTQDLASN